MDVNTRNRTELKSYFVKNSIPTESNFAELIDGMLNQKDDGLVKLPDNPLSIEASGDETSERKLINFYRNFGDSTPDWTLNLNPRSEPNNPETAKLGFNISDGEGNSRLFIDHNNGNVGIGNIDPKAELDVDGTVNATTFTGDGSALENLSADKITTGTLNVDRIPDLSADKITTETLNADRIPNLSADKITGGTIDGDLNVTGNVGIGTKELKASLNVNGNVGIGTAKPKATLDVNGDMYISDNVGIGIVNPISFAYPVNMTEEKGSTAGNHTEDGRFVFNETSDAWKGGFKSNTGYDRVAGRVLEWVVDTSDAGENDPQTGNIMIGWGKNCAL